MDARSLTLAEDLNTISQELQKWISDFQRAFGRKPAELGLTDRFAFALSKSLEQMRFSGGLEAEEGRDFVLAFTYMGKSRQLFLQAKVERNKLIDFVSGYDAASDGPELHNTPPSEKLANNEARTNRMKSRGKAEKHPGIVEETPEKMEQRLREEAEKNARIKDMDQGFKAKIQRGENNKRISLQAERLHRKISQKPLPEGIDYVGGGYIIYGHRERTGVRYIPINAVKQAYDENIDKATSVANLNELINKYIFNGSFDQVLRSILTDNNEASTYSEWPSRTFQA